MILSFLSSKVSQYFTKKATSTNFTCYLSWNFLSELWIRLWKLCRLQIYASLLANCEVNSSYYDCKVVNQMKNAKQSPPPKKKNLIHPHYIFPHYIHIFFIYCMQFIIKKIKKDLDICNNLHNFVFFVQFKKHEIRLKNIWLKYTAVVQRWI